MNSFLYKVDNVLNRKNSTVFTYIAFKNSIWHHINYHVLVSHGILKKYVKNYF